MKTARLQIDATDTYLVTGEHAPCVTGKYTVTLMGTRDEDIINDAIQFVECIEVVEQAEKSQKAQELRASLRDFAQALEAGKSIFAGMHVSLN